MEKEFEYRLYIAPLKEDGITDTNKRFTKGIYRKYQSAETALEKAYRTFSMKDYTAWISRI